MMAETVEQIGCSCNEKARLPDYPEFNDEMNGPSPLLDTI
jgi:hypothetical protein